MCLPIKEEIPSAPAIQDLSTAKIVFATDGGLYPEDNPDKMRSANAVQFCSYSTQGMDRFDKEGYTIIHNGFDSTFLKADPNRLVPLDTMREVEREGKAQFYNEYLSTTGLTTNVVNSTKIGKSMAKYVKDHNIDAVILTPT